MRVATYLHMSYVVLETLAIMHLFSGAAGAAISCYQCHGTSPPADYRPLDAAYRNPSTGGFQGNHRTHMGADATPSTCSKCHPGSGGYTSRHSRDSNNRIKVSSRINNSPLTTLYNNHTSAFPQTATPTLASCSNVNCHFEVTSPAWGSDPAATNCSTCHGAPPSGVSGNSYAGGAAGSHAKHDQYFSGAANCRKCHADNTTFQHATSAGKRNLVMNFAAAPNNGGGSYSGSLNDYLPSQSNGFGNCSATYCHSNGTSVSTGTVPANTSPAWGSGALACNGCHGNMTYGDRRKAFPLYTTGKPKTNSHKAHISIDCNKCHLNTTSDGVSISNTANHVNKSYNVNAGGGVSYTYTYNASGGSCSSISCHSNGSAQWGTTIACGACHAVTAATLAGRGHFTHLTSAIGPRSNCDACHGTGATTGIHAGHGNGAIIFADGNSLSGTSSCNTCHSPGGTYDGVNDGAIGAKTNWTFGVYTGILFRSGKEKWCAGCHDESPAVIQAINAPKVIGYENLSTVYGKGFGFYKTGHGLAANQTYPASGGRGAGVGCLDCHNSSMRHIDGVARTYVPNRTYGTYNPVSANYQNGYRLKDVPSGYAGKYPLHMPRTGHIASGNAPGFRQDWEFALCFSCHDKEKLFNGGDSVTGAGAGTNFRGISNDDNRDKSSGKGRGFPFPKIGSWYSMHDVHTWGIVNAGSPLYDSNFNGVADSGISCVSCHNVHGSSSPAMIRNGELINKAKALDFRYAPYTSIGPYPRLAQSTGGRIGVSATSQGSIASSNTCNMCHSGKIGYARPPLAPDSAPPVIAGVEGWQGSNKLRVVFSEGVYKNANGTGNLAPENFILTDNDNHRTIISVNHSAGYAAATLVLSAPLDSSGDFGTDTLAAATSSSIYDRSGNAMNAAPVLLSEGTPGVRTLTLHANGLDSANSDDWRVSGGAWSKVLRSNDGDASYVAKVNDQSLTPDNPDYYFYVRTDTPEALEGASIRNIRIFARARYLSGWSMYNGPSAGVIDIGYKTGSATVWQTGNAIPAVGGYTLVSSGAYINNPDGGALGWDDLKNLRIAVKKKTTGSVSLRVTEVYAEVEYDPNDTTAPTVQSSTPANGATDVALNNNVTINWSEHVDCSTVNATNITTSAGGWALSSCSGGRAVFTTSGQSAFTPYTVTVSTAVKDLNGNAMTSNSQFSYTTDDGVVKLYVPAQYATIQGAIDAAVNGNHVVVSDGYYYESINFNGKAITVRSVNGAVSTYIVGSGADSPVVTFSNGETASAVLNGFAITNQACSIATRGIFISNDSSPTISNSTIESNCVNGCSEDGGVCGGGGVYIKDSDPVFDACIIRNNYINNHPGGGVYVTGASSGPTFTGVTVDGNAADGCGGGGFFVGSGATLQFTGGSINGNTGGLSGGGIAVEGASILSVSKAKIRDNMAFDKGGGIYYASSSVTPASITNCAITGNMNYAGMGIGDGGGIYSSGAEMVIINSSIADNKSFDTGTGGGIKVQAGSTVNVKNSIVYGNTSDGSGTDNIVNNGTISVTYSDIEGGFTGAGNINANPQFGANYHINAGSPCKDTGLNADAPAGTDIDGDNRIINGTVDMGSDEYNP